MGFSIDTNQAKSFIKEADGKQNPYSKDKAKTGDDVTQNEAAMHLVDLQNGAGGADRASKGSLFQTMLTGNEGKGYFDQIAALDGVVSSISDKDMEFLASYDGNRNDVSAEDFKQLNQKPEQNTNKPTVGEVLSRMTAKGVLQNMAKITGVEAVGNGLSAVGEGIGAVGKDLFGSSKPQGSAEGKQTSFDTQKAESDKKLLKELQESQAAERKSYIDQLNSVNSMIEKNTVPSMKMMN